MDAVGRSPVGVILVVEYAGSDVLPASLEGGFRLSPGEQVGGSRVHLKGTRSKAWRASATRNNDGDISTGEQQMGLGLDWDSPLGLADQLGNLEFVAREVVKAEELVDYTRRENVAERLAKKFGASIGEGMVRALKAAPGLR